jgi:hypothetical protein
MDNQNTLVWVILVIAIVVALIVWMQMQRKKSQDLRKQFGPEYKQAVDTLGSRDKAEAELQARQKRVEKLNIVPLSPADAQRFNDEWRALQARFVDNPQGALADADRLVRDLMQKRGYPMGDFERRAADISVHHPQVVANYRAAHDIARRDLEGGVDTEGMRQAVIHYRALFAELLEVDERSGQAQHPQQATRTAS